MLAELRRVLIDQLHDPRQSGAIELAEQLEKLDRLKATRDDNRVRQALAALKEGARGTANTMPLLLEAVRAYATVGEMCDALREVWGEYEETPII